MKLAPVAQLTSPAQGNGRPFTRLGVGPWTGLEPLDRRLRSRWLQWMDGPSGQARVAMWSLHHPLFESWTTDSLAAPRSSPSTDRMQAALVALAQGGDVDAAHTLLLQLKPALLSIVKTSPGGRDGSNIEVCAEVQSAFFETLYRHSLPRRPNKIAANLVLDTRSRNRIAADSGSGIGAIRPGGLKFEFESMIDGRPDTTRTVEPHMGAVAAIRSVLDALPGSDDSRRLTATVAFRAWVLEESISAIALDLELERQIIITRLYRLRGALKKAKVNELLAA